jgi:hypothetical protein
LDHYQRGRPRGAAVYRAPVRAVVIGHAVARRLKWGHLVDRPATWAEVLTRVRLVRVGVRVAQGISATVIRCFMLGILFRQPSSARPTRATMRT